MELPEKLRYLRHYLGLNEKQFARMFGYRKRTIRNWECKKARPSEKEVGPICRYFGFPPGYFLDSRVTIYKYKELTPNDVVLKHDPLRPGDKLKRPDKKGSDIIEDYGHEDNARYEEKD